MVSEETGGSLALPSETTAPAPAIEAGDEEEGMGRRRLQQAGEEIPQLTQAARFLPATLLAPLAEALETPGLQTTPATGRRLRQVGVGHLLCGWASREAGTHWVKCLPSIEPAALPQATNPATHSPAACLPACRCRRRMRMRMRRTVPLRPQWRKAMRRRGRTAAGCSR